MLPIRILPDGGVGPIYLIRTIPHDFPGEAGRVLSQARAAAGSRQDQVAAVLEMAASRRSPGGRIRPLTRGLC